MVPLDHIEVPEKDELPPLRELVATALAKRPDVAMAKMSVENAEISALGTANGILPTLQGICDALSNSGLVGHGQLLNPAASQRILTTWAAWETRWDRCFADNFPNQRRVLRFQGNIR